MNDLEPLTESVEDYAKAVYTLESRSDSPVATKDLADRLGLSPGSVSGMLSKLVALGLVDHEPYRGVSLTPDGRRVALEVIRRHRLLELYLVQQLDIPWDRVHEEAEILEHYLSPEILKAMASKLGDPRHDPHGDPIPTATLEIDEEDSQPLAQLEPGTTGTFIRVSDSNPEMLKYLTEQGIEILDVLTVREHQPFGGPTVVHVRERDVSLGAQLASVMRIAPDGQDLEPEN